MRTRLGYRRASVQNVYSRRKNPANPASTRSRWNAVRNASPAPTIRTTQNASCTGTSAPRVFEVIRLETLTLPLSIVNGGIKRTPIDGAIPITTPHSQKAAESDCLGRKSELRGQTSEFRGKTYNQPQARVRERRGPPRSEQDPFRNHAAQNSVSTRTRDCSNRQFASPREHSRNHDSCHVCACQQQQQRPTAAERTINTADTVGEFFWS